MTGTVTAVGNARLMADELLQPEMLLKCTRCGKWHEVRHDNDHAGETPHAREMLYWWCGQARYYAGQVGGTSRHPVKLTRVQLPRA